MSEHTLRECTLLAIEYYRSGLYARKAILEAVKAYQKMGHDFTCSQVGSDWATLRSQKSRRGAQQDNLIRVKFLANGLVEISQDGLKVVLLLEEAMEQYPWLFE